jgi:RNA recognition motif-containing protein
MEEGSGAVRIFVGGLPSRLQPDELGDRFRTFGKVLNCEIAPPKQYPSLKYNLLNEFHRGIAFVTLEPKDEASLKKCIQVYDGCKWKGAVLRCQVAKPDYLKRLRSEEEEELAEAAISKQVGGGGNKLRVELENKDPPNRAHHSV